MVALGSRAGTEKAALTAEPRQLFFYSSWPSSNYCFTAGIDTTVKTHSYKAIEPLAQLNLNRVIICDIPR